MTTFRVTSKKCIYCGSAASTRDHVPPKALLDKPYPENLITVASCGPCNNGASDDEQYLVIVLTHISESPISDKKVGEAGQIDRTFVRSPSLEDAFIDALGVDKKTGLPYLNTEQNRIKRVLEKIARGLYFINFKIPLRSEQLGHTKLFQLGGDKTRSYFYKSLEATLELRIKNWIVVQESAFKYYFFVHPHQPKITVCVMEFFDSCWGIVQIFNEPEIIVKTD
jgi:hypothetical protein